MNKLKNYFNSKRFEKPILKHNFNEPQALHEGRQSEPYTLVNVNSEADLYRNAFKENEEEPAHDNSQEVESMNDINDFSGLGYSLPNEENTIKENQNRHRKVETDIYTTDSLQDLKQQLKELLDENDYKGVRKLLRRNDNCNNLKSRELNEDLNVGSHRFVMRNGRMTFIPITQSESLTSKPVKEQEYSVSLNSNSQNNSIIQEIIDVVNPHSIILQQIIDYLHKKDPYFTIQ